MLQDRTRGAQNLALLFSLILISAGYWLWVLLFTLYDVRIDLSPENIRQYLFYNEVLLIGLVIGYGIRSSPTSNALQRWTLASHQALRQLTASMLGVFVVWILSREVQVSRLFLFSFVPVLYLILLVCNARLSPWVAAAVFGKASEQRILLVGSVEKANRMQQWLASKQEVGFRTVGILSDDADAGESAIYPWLGKTEELGGALQERSIHQVILVELPFHLPLLHQCIRVCEQAAVRFLVVSDLDEKFKHSISFFEDSGRRFIEFREEPLEDPLNRAAKRILDILVASAVVVLVLPPVSLVVWILHRIQSPGPLFYRQTRAGMQNRPFAIFKYRTMHLHSLPQTQQAHREDPRIFPAGRWLRRFSLDELPQFLNVLSGEMSVVGPRPHLIEHNETFAKALNHFHVRANIKPGITGMAQIQGFRGATQDEKDIVQRVNADIHYLENWSFILDCQIIVKTIREMILPSEKAV